MYRRSSLFTAGFFVLALLFSVIAPQTTQAQNQRCFPETGFCIAGAIRTYWERNGGLPIFGFPITEQRQETVEGRSLQVQWFERDRLEIQADGTVTAGRLGVQRLEQQGRPWQQGNKVSADPGCIAFRETGHQVCGGFARYWQQNGAQVRLGFPVTGEIQETLGGQNYTVQYFERRRMEFHPEINGGTVLLGLLGREVLDGQNQPPPDPCTQIPQSINAIVDPNCGSYGTVFGAAGGGFQRGERVGAYVTAPTQEVIGAQFQLEADRDGVACCVTFNSSIVPRNSVYEGVWAITFEGVTTGRRAIAYFRLKP
jgi:hypothetical protein